MGQGAAEEILLYPSGNIRITFTKSGSTITTKVGTLHADGLGSIRAVTDANGLAVERTSYRPYGEEVAILQPLTLPETKGFIGERFDDQSGLQYLNARYYDPKLGMFIQPDWWEVMRRGVGTNRYSYAGNDPTNAHDPGGNGFWSDLGNAIGDAARAIGDGIGGIGRSLGLDQGSRNRYHAEQGAYAIEALKHNSGLYQRGLIGELQFETSKSDLIGLRDFHLGKIGRSAAGELAEFGLTYGGLGVLKGAAPSIVASGNTSRVFWSGVGASSGLRARVGAEAFAKAFRSVTLEATFTGNILDKLARAGVPISKSTWDWASRRFAAASTEARAFIDNNGIAYEGSVWSRVEAVELAKKGINAAIEVWK